MGKTIAFTSAALNYLPKVRKLCASIRTHHPEWAPAGRCSISAAW